MLFVGVRRPLPPKGLQSCGRSSSCQSTRAQLCCGVSSRGLRERGSPNVLVRIDLEAKDLLAPPKPQQLLNCWQKLNLTVANCVSGSSGRLSGRESPLQPKKVTLRVLWVGLEVGAASRSPSRRSLPSKRATTQSLGLSMDDVLVCWLLHYFILWYSISLKRTISQ